MSAVLISIIGPPAAGKTTLARLLSQDLPAELLLEDWSGNPHLEESYAGDGRSRLPGQLYFLRSRVRQLAEATWPAVGIVVSDYGFCQDRIFAEMRLSEDDLAEYDRCAHELAPTVHPPDLLIHLTTHSPVLLHRIARRGRQFERVMDERFLQAMSDAYVRASSQIACPVLEISCDHADLRQAVVRQDLVGKIRGILR